MNSWNTEGPLLTINQKGYSKWVFILVGLFGIVCLPIGFIGMMAHLIENGFDFTKPLLIFHGITVLGIGMISAGFFSSAKRFRERIVFDNKAEIVFIYMNSATGPYKLPYGMISHIHTYMEKGGPDYPTLYHIYLMKNDGAECWITGDSKRDEFLKRVRKLADHTGFAVRDSSGLGTERPAGLSYTSGEIKTDYQLSPYVVIRESPQGTVISIKSASLGAFNYLMGIFIYLFFLTVPLYLLNIFSANEYPIIVRGFLYLFCAVWYGILITTMMISAKKYTLTVSDLGVRVAMKCRMLPFITALVEIPRDRIRHVRTNRLPDGKSMLSLDMDSAFTFKKNGPAFIMNLGIFKDAKLAQTISGGMSLSLWDVSAITKKGKGPTISDLAIIEKFIEEKLMLDASA